jgi:hypothetical protein
MTAKHNSLYLFLALACFVGIILIFVFDGYMGVYDTLAMDNGQFQQTVEGDQWARQEKYGGFVSVPVERGGRIDFTYTVENHRFTEYSADIKITLWQNKAQIGDIGFIPDEPLIIPAFNKKELTWSITPDYIIPADYPAEQSYNVNMEIKRGDIVRQVNVNIYASQTAAKTIPLPAPPR